MLHTRRRQGHDVLGNHPVRIPDSCVLRRNPALYPNMKKDGQSLSSYGFTALSGRPVKGGELYLPFASMKLYLLPTAVFVVLGERGLNGERSSHPQEGCRPSVVDRVRSKRSLGAVQHPPGAHLAYTLVKTPTSTATASSVPSNS